MYAMYVCYTKNFTRWFWVLCTDDRQTPDGKLSEISDRHSNKSKKLNWHSSVENYFELSRAALEVQLSVGWSVGLSVCPTLQNSVPIYLRCTLRSGLHGIPTMIRTFPHGLENNHACKWISDNSPRILTYILFLEYCIKPVCMHGCSPIYVERYFSS